MRDRFCKGIWRASLYVCFLLFVIDKRISIFDWHRENKTPLTRRKRTQYPCSSNSLLSGKFDEICRKGFLLQWKIFTRSDEEFSRGMSRWSRCFLTTMFIYFDKIIFEKKFNIFLSDENSFVLSDPFIVVLVRCSRYSSRLKLKTAHQQSIISSKLSKTSFHSIEEETIDLFKILKKTMCTDECFPNIMT